MTAIIIKGRSGNVVASNTYQDQSFLWLEAKDYNRDSNIWQDRSPYKRQLNCQGGNPLPIVTNGRMRINASPSGQGFVVPNFPRLAMFGDDNISLTLLTTIYLTSNNRVDWLGNRLLEGGASFIRESNLARIIIAGTSSNPILIYDSQVGVRENIAWTWVSNSNTGIGYFNGNINTVNYSTLSNAQRGASQLFIGFPSLYSSTLEPVDISFVSCFLRQLSTNEITEVFNLVDSTSNANNVILFCPFSTNFNDLRNNVITPINNPIIAQKNGINSLSLNGSNQRLTINHNNVFNFENNDWCIETFVNFNTLSVDQGIFYLHDNFQPTISLRYNTTEKINLIVYQNNADVVRINTNNLSLNTNKWIHLAATRTGNTYRLFVDGILQQAVNNSASIVTSNNLSITIGAISQMPTAPFWFFNGHISSLRITKGFSRYTENFTPPSIPITTL